MEKEQAVHRFGSTDRSNYTLFFNIQNVNNLIYFQIDQFNRLHKRRRSNDMNNIHHKGRFQALWLHYIISHVTFYDIAYATFRYVCLYGFSLRCVYTNSRLLSVKRQRSLMLPYFLSSSQYVLVIYSSVI